MYVYKVSPIIGTDGEITTLISVSRTNIKNDNIECISLDLLGKIVHSYINLNPFGIKYVGMTPQEALEESKNSKDLKYYNLIIDLITLMDEAFAKRQTKFTFD